MSFWGHLFCFAMVLWFIGWVLWQASKEYRAKHPEIETAATEVLMSFLRWLKW